MGLPLVWNQQPPGVILVRMIIGEKSASGHAHRRFVLHRHPDFLPAREEVSAQALRRRFVHVHLLHLGALAYDTGAVMVVVCA